MSRILFFCLAAALLLTSCETTGDPGQGGLFQWSQGKANQRSAALQQHLGDVEANTAYQQRRARALEEKRADKQRELNEQQQ